jgi:ATP-dependent RNA helicase RhlB
MENNHLSDITFASLGLVPALLRGLDEAGYTNCTPIQAATLPNALANHDVAGQAQTGTGKTAAFLVATMNYLLKNPVEEGREGPWAIMLAPTRELALQIHKDFELLGKHTGLFGVAVYGGAGYESQQRELELGVDIVIGTPGRIIDFHKQGLLPLNNIEVVVLDEADRMFDLGFINDIRYLLRRMPPPDKRINMLFSATLSNRVMELAYEHMNQPEVVRIEPAQVTAENVRQLLYHVSKDDKMKLLIQILRDQNLHRTIVFVNTKRRADDVMGYLQGNGYDAAVISGDIPQSRRERLLKRFQDGELPLLVAPDVAARGLHIPEVSHVINFDLPQDAEDYVHRIGRTARAGASGDAISFACEEYVYSLPDIEKYIGDKIPTEKVDLDALPELQPPRRVQRSRSPVGRGNGSRGGNRPHRPRRDSSQGSSSE